MDTTTAAATAGRLNHSSSGAPGTVPALHLAGVTKHFGAVRAVDGIDLVVQPGEVVAFLGPNGAGKTTTIDMVLGLSQPSSGELSVCGTTPRGAVASGWVSAVMQTGGLLKDLSVGETVELTASLFARTQPVDVVLQRAGIADIADRRVGKCSGGQQQRLRFAMALLPDPRLLVLDEPTTGMDVEGRRAFWAAIRDDARRGRTVLFATHYLEEADAHADRIVLVAGGRVVADGTAAQIKALSTGRSVRATLPGVRLSDLAAMPGVDELDVQGDTVLVQANDSDAVARWLLTRTAARDLEVTSRGLEDAFISLTSTTSTDEVPR